MMILPLKNGDSAVPPLEEALGECEPCVFLIEYCELQ